MGLPRGVYPPQGGTEKSAHYRVLAMTDPLPLLSLRGGTTKQSLLSVIFFKDPATFVPPNESVGEDIVDAVVDSVFDGLLGKKEKQKNNSGSYRPVLRENGHPASMSKPWPVFTAEEIDVLAPEIVRAFAELRKGEHLTLRTRAFDSQGRGGSKWNESRKVTSVAIRFLPAGNFLGVAHGATISWDFYKMDGLDFRGKGGGVLLVQDS